MEDSKLEGWSFFFLLHTSRLLICLETSSLVFHPPPFAHLSLPASIGCEALSFLVVVVVYPAMVPSPPFTSPSSPITPITPVTPINPVTPIDVEVYVDIDVDVDVDVVVVVANDHLEDLTSCK